MSNKDKSEVPVEVVRKAPVVAMPTARRVSFEQWAKGKKIPERHFSGMKAHVKDPSRPRTEADWAAAFVGY